MRKFSIYDSFLQITKKKKILMPLRFTIYFNCFDQCINAFFRHFLIEIEKK